MILPVQNDYPANPEPQMNPAERANKPRILVIDDELGPRESLRILLKPNYDVVCTEGVDAGVQALSERRPDLVIMDIRMPKKNGIEGLREIRGLDPVVPVIMLTGFGALETAQEALRLGANDYLKKPFDTQEIQEIIERNLQRVEIERRRVQAASDLRNLNAKLSEELSQKEHLATVGQASAEFVHDLRNPLTIVMGYVQLLSDQLRDQQRQLGVDMSETSEYLEIIERNVVRCQEMAHMWQDFSRQSVVPPEPTRLGDLVGSLVEGVEPLAFSCGTRLSLHVADEIEALVRPGDFLRALHNIVANAVHAAAERQDGLIDITISRSGGEARVEVADNGKGMTPEQLARAGEPYFTTKAPGKGTGLGLSIARRVMEQHGGRLEIASEVGKGTKVTLALPL